MEYILNADCVMYIVDNFGNCVYFIDGKPVCNVYLIAKLDTFKAESWEKHYICQGELHYCGILKR